jgi:hypothetical protein
MHIKRDSAQCVAHLRESGSPAVLTVKGKPALVVIKNIIWQETQDRLAYAHSVAAIRRGLLQDRAGENTEATIF